MWSNGEDQLFGSCQNLGDGGDVHCRQSMHWAESKRQLSNEQRARITQNFRAAKALLACKRPRTPLSIASQQSPRMMHSTPAYDENAMPCCRLEECSKKVCTATNVNASKRLPLAQLNGKEDSAKHVDGLAAIGKTKQSCSLEMASYLLPLNPGSNLAVSNAPNHAFESQGKSPCSRWDCEESSIDIDEEIMREIDLLCKQKTLKQTFTTSVSKCKEQYALKDDMGNNQGRLSLHSNNLDHPPNALMLDIPTYLLSLNESQRDAALSDTFKPLLILAGPGSGKGVNAKNILAMTFTTAAASEMRERVGALVGSAVSKELSISTFHSFCLQLCRLHAEKLGRSADFLVYGNGQQKRAVIEATRLALAENISDSTAMASDLNNAEHPKCEANNLIKNPNPIAWKDKARKWQQFVTHCKSAGRTPQEIENSGNLIGAAVLRHYEETLAACDALDYHDLISFSVTLLNKHHEVLEECQKSWTCLLVDEFQDTSAMQYKLLQLLAKSRLTVVGDDDQSIFSFNGANSCGFDWFRKDFLEHKEVRLHQNYRSTRCIVEAASCLIRNNLNRCQTKQPFTANAPGDRIVLRECRNEDAQCAFVVDTIYTNVSSVTTDKPAFGEIAVLYRRQITGRLFQSVFRARKIPFNVHGVAFYRKKVIKYVIALLWSSLAKCDDIYCKRAIKALYAGDKAEIKKVVEYVEKLANSMKCPFLQAARNIFTAKISGTFSRRQLCQGKKVITSIDMVQRLVKKEQSLSALITAVVNLLPQRTVFQTRAIVDENGGKLLNEDDDPRSILQYLLDDVRGFLCNRSNTEMASTSEVELSKPDEGCISSIQAFLDYVSARESENFRSMREENKNSVTLTTMHQSKGLEWDTVFIVKANEFETPLLHETMGSVDEGSTSLEEERRLFYVAMTRARKKLLIVYVTVNPQRQVLQPSRFLKELPRHLLDVQGSIFLPESSGTCLPLEGRNSTNMNFNSDPITTLITKNPDSQSDEENVAQPMQNMSRLEGVASNNAADPWASPNMETFEGAGNVFLKGFNLELRSTIAAIFHTWAKKSAFQDPKRLLCKVGFVVDERLCSKSVKNKDVLHALKCSLKDEAAVHYAQHVVNFEKLPLEERAVLKAERQEHFQQQSGERLMSAAAATAKQISYLKNLGCTVNPTSRLHASHLIEQYKAL
ncbi:hypothetical protein O6H91_12G053800 [Diphasiastrum complanatum]|uniref:Uncharacterized protein n=2 Tax=Diphasiastrum complanatum TaxID=34168 RepID=A0ACC2C1X9_DIPCM|nr:hypothetical protein O6H91_12G053800 [Diphasiastrum complanatum]